MNNNKLLAISFHVLAAVVFIINVFLEDAGFIHFLLGATIILCLIIGSTFGNKHKEDMKNNSN